ncbi:MAG TPA: DNA polymerase III subunit delta [Rhodocyclaceae bacterium]|nr:DNA polymerase III subunit delta [Rhodocyclaceae bacterium]
MQLRPEQLAAHLDKPLAPLYVVFGDQPLLTVEAGDAIRAAARRQGFEREVLVATANFRWEELFLAGGNLSLFGSAKLIDLRIPSGKPGRDGGEALQRYCKLLGPGASTLVTLPEVDWQTRKAAWFAALVDAGIAVECNGPTLAQLPAWIAERLKRQGQAAPREALDFIAAHVEGNLLAAHQELQKLGLLYPEGTLTLAQVEAAVLNVARYDVDSLREALLAGDAARCARTLDGLKAEAAAPPLVLWALANEARTVAMVRTALDRNGDVDAALKAQKVFGPRQQPYRNAARRISAAAAKAAVLHAARIDRMIKGVAKGDVWDEFLQLALRLARS